MKNATCGLALLALLAGDARAEGDSRSPQVFRCPADIRQEEYGQRRFRNDIRQIFHVSREYTWLREQLLRRLPDDSLFCAFFTGGKYDGHPQNLVAAMRSDDDGQTWSPPEVVRGFAHKGCWAPSMLCRGDRAYLFWYTKSSGWNDMVSYLAITGPGGREFSENRRTFATPEWTRLEPQPTIDVRHAAHLHDGRVLLPISWKGPDGISYVAVAEPDEEFRSFQRFGRIAKPTPDGPTASIPLFEPAIADRGGGKLSMLIRGDTNQHPRPQRLWRADSEDGGRTWSEPYLTDIPNPGTKPRILNLSDGRIVLFHNPWEKDFSDPQVLKDHHRHRTNLSMWVSDDAMRSWSVKRVIVSPPYVAQYPDAFFDATARAIYLSWEDDKTIYFVKIHLDELSAEEASSRANKED